MHSPSPGATGFLHIISAPAHTPIPGNLDLAICRALRSHETQLVLLSGYNKLLGPRTLDALRGKILNTHPAPLPEFGGKGMYGMRVHEAVLAARLERTAVSIHVVEDESTRAL